MRRLLALCFASLLVLVACGDDDSDADSSDDSVAADEYIDALAAAFLNNADGDALTESQEEADCAARAVTSDFGQERLEEVGLTIDELADGLAEGGLPDLTVTESEAFVTALRGCVAFGTSIAAGLFGDNADADQVACFNTWIEDSPTYADFLARSLREGEEAGLEEAQAIELADKVFECFGAGELFRATYSDEFEVTDEQVTCLNESLLSTDDYRDAFVRGLTGDADDTGAEPAFLDEIGVCIPLEG